MSEESIVFEVIPNTEGILSVKRELERRACKDSVLLSILDFSESVFRHNPLSKAMMLQVKSQSQCLTIGNNTNLIYTVSADGRQPRIDCRVHSFFTEITDSDIKRIHFSVHSCQDEIRSCFKEAKDAVMSKPRAIKITCNRFSITYTTGNLPDEMKMIETKCRFNLNSITVEALLEKKYWMEREKMNSKQLISCLEHLIKIYLTLPGAPTHHCRFILQGNKEMAEIISHWVYNKGMKQYIVMQEHDSEIRIYPPLE